MSVHETLVLAPERRRQTVLRAIRSARERLILSLFRCDDLAVLDALADARQRGVRVQAIITRRSKGAREALEALGARLLSIGVELSCYDDPSVKYHAKYLVADAGPALVASSNFNQKCFERTFDVILTTDDPDVVAGLEALFDADRQGPGKPLPRSLTPRLIVGPERAREQMLALLQQARQRIRIIDPKLSDAAMVALLKDRHAAGVDVQVIGGDEVGRLTAHGKMFSVDRTAAAIGSMSLAPAHLDSRREVAVVVTEPALVDQLNNYFDEVVVEHPAHAVPPGSLEASA